MRSSSIAIFKDLDRRSGVGRAYSVTHNAYYKTTLEQNSQGYATGRATSSSLVILSISSQKLTDLASHYMKYSSVV